MWSTNPGLLNILVFAGSFRLPLQLAVSLPQKYRTFYLDIVIRNNFSSSHKFLVSLCRDGMITDIETFFSVMNFIHLYLFINETVGLYLCFDRKNSIFIKSDHVRPLDISRRSPVGFFADLYNRSGPEELIY